MPSSRVQFISTDNLDLSITVSVDGVRVEYFLGDRYHGIRQQVKEWLEAGWTNYAVSRLTSAAWRIQIVGSEVRQPHEPVNRKVKVVATSIDHSKTPSPEYSYTLIAPSAKSLTYNDERKWFKTPQDAATHAASIYDGETKKNFDLCVVQCVDILAPKPQIELQSRWKKDTASV